jgi:hypothetical protein
VDIAVGDPSLSVCDQHESFSEWFCCYGRFLILVNARVNYTLQLGKSLDSNFQQPVLLPVKGRWCKHISWFYLALPCVHIALVHITAEGRFLENLLCAV